MAGPDDDGQRDRRPRPCQAQPGPPVSQAQAVAPGIVAEQQDDDREWDRDEQDEPLQRRDAQDRRIAPEHDLVGQEVAVEIDEQGHDHDDDRDRGPGWKLQAEQTERGPVLRLGRVIWRADERAAKARRPPAAHQATLPDSIPTGHRPPRMRARSIPTVTAAAAPRIT